MSQTVTTPQGVKHITSKSEITLDKVYKADYQKEKTITAQLRQVVVTKSFYPTKKTSSSLQANIFATEDFGFENKEFESTENRVAWLTIPEGSSEADIKAKLAAANTNGATIYRVLSSEPILDENQIYAINNPDLPNATKDGFANSQVMRYPDNETTRANGTSGKLILDAQGNPQYRRTFFWLTPMEDQDVRGVNFYQSPEIAAELAGASVMAGQTL